MATMRRHPVGPRILRRLPEGWKPARFQCFDVSPVTPTIGAELSGLSLENVDDELFAELDRALLEWKVLIVRNQPIDVAAQGALARRWGPLTDDQLIPNPGTAAQTDAITFERNDTVVGLENMWHTDGTFREHPPVCTILGAIEVPPVGGDTLFADMAAAWDNLDPRTTGPTRLSFGPPRLEHRGICRQIRRPTRRSASRSSPRHPPCGPTPSTHRPAHPLRERRVHDGTGRQPRRSH